MYFQIALFVILVCFNPTIQGQQGVYLSLKGASIANNSYVAVDDIGEYESALLCHTNKTDCCHNPYRAGEWYFPDGSKVETSSWNYNFALHVDGYFYRDRDQSVVRLNRRNKALERGHFHCQLPDANDVSQNLYVNILDRTSVVISPSRHSVVGEMFIISCSVNISLPLNVPPPHFEWFFGQMNSSLPSGVTAFAMSNSGNIYNSTLQFSPLQLSHTGMYTCHIGGNPRLEASINITADCDGGKVQVTGDESSIYAGDRLSLRCSFMDSRAAPSVITYQWKKNGFVIQNETESSLSFSSITLSDAGQYICEVIVNSTLYCGTKDITLEIPAPSFVMITSNPVSPIRPVGSEVAVICSIELSSTVDVPMTANIQITNPSGNLLSATTPSLLDSTYTSTAMIRSFNRTQSGVYTCEATLSSDSPFLTESGTLSKDVRITTHVYVSVGNVRVLENDTYLFITDIGTEAPHQLVCTSDIMPCCRDPPQYGEWKFPNGSHVIHISEGAVLFHRNRDNVGNVNLYRVNNDVTSPGGKFCCEIEDASNLNQTLCVNIVPPISNEIIDSGNTPIAGESYSLACSVSGASITSYKWRKNDDLLSEAGPTLWFSALRLSDAGLYTCEVRVYIWTYSAHHEIYLKIPDPSVTVVSNKSNPIRPLGSAVSLTSRVELSTSVDVPVTVNIVWTGPNGFMSAYTSQPTMAALSNLVTIASLDRNQSGNYSCTVSVHSPSSMIVDSNRLSVFTKITVGVYISMGGEILPSNRVIFVTDIGISKLSQYLICTTDRIPCCRDPYRYGEWRFPNGNPVIPINHGAVTFHRNRDNDGNINLFRVSNDVVSPTGRFCCETADATDTNHTLCVNIIPPIIVQVRDGGSTPIAGQSYTLTCSIDSTITTYPHTLNYQWTKNNGTHTEVGTDSSSISFPVLTLSNSGGYTCIVTVSSTSLKEDNEQTSATYNIDVPIPQPVMRLVSKTSNPVPSGSSPNLICTVELNPAVDVPVDITTVWSGPDGSTLTADASPVMKSSTYYTSKLTLNYVESEDSGNYTCKVDIEGKISATVSKEIVIGDGMFQLRLINADICQSWFKSANSDKEMELYKQSIEEALVEAIESHCECHFPKENLLKTTFRCSSSPNLTTYRNTLIGTNNFNATQLIGFIQDWVTSEPHINIKGYDVWLDRSCPVAIASLNDPECGEVSQCPGANDPNVAKCVEHLGNEDFTACINSCI